MAAETQCGSKHLMNSSEQGYGSNGQDTKRPRLTPEVDFSQEEYVSELLVPSGADNEKAGAHFCKHACLTPEVPPGGAMVCHSAPAVPWGEDNAIDETGMVIFWEAATCIGATVRHYEARWINEDGGFKKGDSGLWR